MLGPGLIKHASHFCCSVFINSAMLCVLINSSTDLARLSALALALVAFAARMPWSILAEIELLLFWVAPCFSWAYPSLVFALALALVLDLGLAFFSLLYKVAPLLV